MASTEQAERAADTVGIDVLIAGGGPAGLSAAAAAAERGLAVTVVERKQAIGVPVHTSGGTSIETMLAFGIPETLYHPIHRIRFVGPTEQATFVYADPVLCVIDVRGVYQYLAEVAEGHGATVLLDRNVAGVDVSETGVTATIAANGDGSDATIAAKIVVDATGYRAAVSKRSGLHPGFTRFGVGAEFELLAPSCDQSEVVLIVGDRWAPAGYGWVFPWGNDRVRFGVGVHHADVKDDPKLLLEAMFEHAGEFGVDVSGSTIDEVHHGLIPAEAMPRQLVGDGVMAVGDAACQATLVVGEGIRLSMIAGSIAGRVAADALQGGRSDAAALAPYEREFRARFGRELSFGRVLNNRFAKYEDDDWDDAIRLLRKMPSSLVADFLQARLSARPILEWVVTSPLLWPRIAKNVVRVLVARARGPAPARTARRRPRRRM